MADVSDNAIRELGNLDWSQLTGGRALVARGTWRVAVAATRRLRADARGRLQVAGGPGRVRGCAVGGRRDPSDLAARQPSAPELVLAACPSLQRCRLGQRRDRVPGRRSGRVVWDPRRRGAL